MKNRVLFVLFLFSSLTLYAGNSASPANIRLSGRLFLDGGIYTNPPAGLHAGIGIPDIRLGAKVNILSNWYTKIDIGFAKNKVALKDAFVQYSKNENYFRLGYMIGYFSLEESNSTNDYIFHTAANVAETFYPGRRIGVSYTRSVADYYFSVGAFCGDGLNFSENIRQGYNFTGRGVWRPFHMPHKLLHIGAGTLFKVPDKNTDTGTSPLTLGSKGVTYLASPQTVGLTFADVSQEIQANVECLAFVDKWMFQSEYLWTGVKQKGIKEVYHANGGYIQTGFLLKGSQLNYDETDALAIMPSDPHSILLICRYNCTDLNDYSAALFGGKQHDVSVGINYYFNQYICSKLNYSQVWLDEFSGLGKKRFGMVQARLQVRF